jgi:hypothetical protein
MCSGWRIDFVVVVIEQRMCAICYFMVSSLMGAGWLCVGNVWCDQLGDVNQWDFIHKKLQFWFSWQSSFCRELVDISLQALRVWLEVQTVSRCVMLSCGAWRRYAPTAVPYIRFDKSYLLWFDLFRVQIRALVSLVGSVLFCLYVFVYRFSITSTLVLEHASVSSVFGALS